MIWLILHDVLDIRNFFIYCKQTISFVLIIFKPLFIEKVSSSFAVFTFYNARIHWYYSIDQIDSSKCHYTSAVEITKC